MTPHTCSVQEESGATKMLASASSLFARSILPTHCTHGTKKGKCSGVNLTVWRVISNSRCTYIVLGFKVLDNGTSKGSTTYTINLKDLIETHPALCVWYCMYLRKLWFLMRLTTWRLYRTLVDVERRQRIWPVQPLLLNSEERDKINSLPSHQGLLLW